MQRVWSQKRGRNTKISDERRHFSKGLPKHRSTIENHSNPVRCILLGRFNPQDEKGNSLPYDDFTNISTESSKGHSSLSSSGLDGDTFGGINLSQFSNRLFRNESDSSIIFSDTTAISGKRNISRNKMLDDFLTHRSAS